jgi:hypothetical protein
MSDLPEAQKLFIPNGFSGLLSQKTFPFVVAETKSKKPFICNAFSGGSKKAFICNGFLVRPHTGAYPCKDEH